MKALSHKVALITGGNSGIGLATAKLFAAEGAQVIITARRQDTLDAAVSQIGNGAVGIQGDVADLGHHDRIAEYVDQRFGGLDIYLANAGINTIAHSTKVSQSEFDAQFGVNTKGVFFGVQKISPLI